MSREVKHKRLCRNRSALLCFFLTLICLFSFKGSGEGAGLFFSQSLVVEGQKICVIPTELDGKGWAEMVVVHKTGVYPKERRWISIFRADTSGQYSRAARQRWEVDCAATTFDVGDVAPFPGKEIFYLTGQGVRYYAQEQDGNFSTTPHDLLSFPTITVFPVRPSEKDAETSLSFLSTPVDVNGDGFVDMILTLTRGTGKFLERKIEIFLFMNRQKPDKPFSPQPDQTITVDGITPGIIVQDVNGDGRGDLLLSSIQVGFWNIVKNLISKRVNLDTAIYLLRNDNRYPEQPDFRWKTSYQLDLTHGVQFRGTWPALGGDFTGDGHRDLLIARDEEIAIYPRKLDGAFFSHPLKQSGVLTSPFMRIVDLNGDGRDDLLFYEKKRDGKISVLLNTGKGAKRENCSYADE